uniref:Uncharacterized protein n=1 Tax=Panagrolaimus sp. ES5 TaxID=591445 RepID=A0AC34FPE6_9BILA
MSDLPNPQSFATIKNETLGNDFNDESSIQEKLKLIWMDVVAEKAEQNSPQANKISEQLLNFLQLIDKSVKNGCISYCIPPPLVRPKSYQKVIYCQNYYVKAWESAFEADWNVQKFRKGWFMKQSNCWRSTSLIVLIIHCKWTEKFVIENVFNVKRSVIAAFKIIIPENRKDAEKLRQTLANVCDVDAAICSTANECEAIIKSIEA